MGTDDLLTPASAAAILGVSRRRVLAFIDDGRLAAQNLGGEGRGARWVLRRGDVEAFAIQHRPQGRPRRSRPMVAVEIELEMGTRFIPLSSWDNGAVLIPMDDGHRVLTPDGVRTNWDAWVGDLIADDDLLTREELDAQHPGIIIV